MGRQSGLTGDEAYAILHNKNGVEISGSKTSGDYGIYFSVTDDGTIKIGGD